MHIVLRISIFLLISLPLAALADEDVKGLLKELRDQVIELRAQVRQSNARISELEQSLEQEKARKEAAEKSAASEQPAAVQGQPATVPNVVTAGDVKGTIKLPGSNTSIGFGGFTKLLMMYSDVNIARNKWGHQDLYGADIPVGGSNQSSQFNMHAKETRLWFKSFTPSDFGDINTLVELDLNQSADSYTPRLRHAYGSIGNFLAGQTYTTFTNTAALAEMDAATAVTGNILVRQPMVRWTQPFTSTTDAMFALELPSTRFTRGSGSAIENLDDDRFPDLVVRLNNTQDWGNISLAAMARNIRLKDAANNIDESSWGGALSLAGRVNVGERDNFRFMLNYGDALARYVVNGTYADASYDSSSHHLELNRLYSGTLFYQHYWNPVWRSNLALGYSHSNLPSYASQELTRDVFSAHANVVWNPVPQLNIGLEYLYAMRELQDGRDGDLNRVVFSTRFNF